MEISHPLMQGSLILPCISEAAGAAMLQAMKDEMPANPITDISSAITEIRNTVTEIRKLF